MTAVPPPHFPWCDPDLCDMEPGGNYVAHRSASVELRTYQGRRYGYLYATSMYPKGSVPTVCFGKADENDWPSSVAYTSLVLFMAELESLQLPKVVAP